jgi:hypothetical protein
LKCPSIEAEDIEGCNSFVEDLYLINGNNLDLITRIPRAQKVCRNSNAADAMLDFPMWSIDLQLSPIGKSIIGIDLLVEGMYMIASELSERWRFMGLLDELPMFLQKKFPDKFKQLEQSISDGPIAKIQPSDLKTIEESKNSTFADSTSIGNKESSSLKGFCIPYKAKIESQISISPIDGKMTIAPWKIQLESK